MRRFLAAAEDQSNSFIEHLNQRKSFSSEVQTNIQETHHGNRRPGDPENATRKPWIA